MARPNNPNSVRQLAMKFLDSQTGVKRSEVLIKLKTLFNIGDRYAETLYGTFRTLNQKNGTMPKVYSVFDIRDGKSVEPYVKVINTFNPAANACTTLEAAKIQYRKDMEERIAKCSQL